MLKLSRLLPWVVALGAIHATVVLAGDKKTLEERVAELETRVTALEGKGAGAPQPVPSAGVQAANKEMSALAEAIWRYNLDTRSLPVTLDELAHPDQGGKHYLDKVPLDPWGQQYEYRILDVRKAKFEILSSGADKQMGTDDDIHFPPR